MVKWIKLFSHQYLGFWAVGLLLFLLQKVHYIIMPLMKLESNPIMSMKEHSVILDVAEKILGSLCIAVMTIVVSDRTGLLNTTENRNIFMWCMIAVLLLNYVGWGLYFFGH